LRIDFSAPLHDEDETTTKVTNAVDTKSGKIFLQL